MVVLGVDGGGTKTAFLLADTDGGFIVQTETSGCSLPHIGQQAFMSVLESGVRRLAESAGVSSSDIDSAAFGIPCFGESIETDAQAADIIHDLLPDCRNTIVNDVEAAHAGSLALNAGIHIVAGTGAIVLGIDKDGNKARANGWHEQFSDEGSCYWLGLKTLALFAMQSDHRLPRGPLYDLCRERFGLSEDFSIIPYFEQHLSGQRDRIAEVQLILSDAAAAGDKTAARLYIDAAKELAASAEGVCRALGLDTQKSVPCSYSGGLFKAGDIILEPLIQALAAVNIRLAAPVLCPASGAALLAARAGGLPTGAFINQLKAWRTV